MHADMIFSVKLPQFDGTQKMCKLSSPHSNAFVDLDGDCLAGMIFCMFHLNFYADLFVTCSEKEGDASSSYQVWVNEKSRGFRLQHEGPLPKGAGPISFADIGSLIINTVLY